MLNNLDNAKILVYLQLIFKGTKIIYYDRN